MKALRAESANEPRLDPILRHWNAFAALAWESFLEHGRGIVLIELNQGGGGQYDYSVGSICDCHEDWVQEYEPDREIIVSIRRKTDKHASIHRLSGLKTPPEAYQFIITKRVRKS